MASIQAAFALNPAIKTSPVIGEVVDIQLREAAWASMARRRQWATPTSALSSLARWEHALCSNMAGLAAVYTPRLAARLGHLLHTPQELVSESFVAGVLLLRCHRERHEAQVMAAWLSAPSAEARQQIASAIVHGGLRAVHHQQQICELVVSQDSELRRSASSIAVGLRLKLGPSAHTLSQQADSHIDAALIELDHMAMGLCPVRVPALVAALQSCHADMRHAGERVLAAHAPVYLARRARLQLSHKQSPSLLGLEALAGLLRAPHGQRKSDLTLLQHACRAGRLGPLAAQALALSAMPQAAFSLLLLLANSHDDTMPEPLLEAFYALSGIEARDAEHQLWQTCKHRGEVARSLQLAWGHPHQDAASEVPILFGKEPCATELLRASGVMTVGRWQSYLRLLHSRSHAHIAVDSWALLQQQKAQIAQDATRVDHALGTGAPGLLPNALDTLLARMPLPLPEVAEQAWA